VARDSEGANLKGTMDEVRVFLLRRRVGSRGQVEGFALEEGKRERRKPKREDRFLS
jgi:hypothetical protein